MLKTNKLKNSLNNKKSEIQSSTKSKLTCVKCCSPQFYMRMFRSAHHCMWSKLTNYISISGTKQINLMLDNPDKLRNGLSPKLTISIQDQQIYNEKKQCLLQMTLDIRNSKYKIQTLAQYYKFYNTSPILFQKGFNRIMNECKYRKKIIVYKNFLEESVAIRNQTESNVKNSYTKKKVLDVLNDDEFPYYNFKVFNPNSEEEQMKKQRFVEKKELQQKYKKIIKMQNDDSGVLVNLNERLSILIKKFERNSKKQIDVHKIRFKQVKTRQKSRDLSIIAQISEIKRTLVVDYNSENKMQKNRNNKNKNDNEKNQKNYKIGKNMLNNNEDYYGLHHSKSKKKKGKQKIILNRKSQKSSSKHVKYKHRSQKSDTEYFVTQHHSQKKTHNRCGSEGYIKQQSSSKKSHKYTSSCLSKY